MSEEWFDIAYINYDEAILWGHLAEGVGMARTRRQVRITLSDEQKRAVEDLNFKHEQETTKLLRSFAA